MRSRDGGWALSGRLEGHDGVVHRLRTEHGLLTLDAGAFACEGPGCPDGPGIVVEGDPELTEILMPALLEAFASHRGLRHTRDGHVHHLEGVDGSLRVQLRRDQASSGAADLLLSRGGPRATDLQAARRAGSGRIDAPGRQKVVGSDALVPIVGPGRPGTLSMDDLVGMLAGRVQDWEDVGGRSGPITVHVQAGLVGAIEGRLLGPAGLTLGPDVVRHEGGGAARAVARDPGAVGVTSLNDAGLAEPVALAGPCGLVSRPGRDAVRAGDWPLSLPLTIVLPAAPLPPLAADLALFASSTRAQAVVRRAGYLDRAPGAIALAEQGERLAEAVLGARTPADLDALQDVLRELQSLTRLTPTFRFTSGTTLDAASRETADALVEAIASGVYDGRRLVFVGFGDGTGDPDRTRTLSRNRARAVLEAVGKRMPVRRDGPVLSAMGHGAALPVACDIDAEGRRLNRRVELWVR